ncbi:MAG TPA: glycosyltransferase family 4 protein [Candidatus Acidoferrales bacterium]|nr:glycosyltransferase family 4 protein [Candidatus Acidoferrales bacterium]
MKIAIFDYFLVPDNPIGGCHLRIVQSLCNEHEFTIFSVKFENPRPDRIRWVRIPAASRPQAFLYLTFHLLAPLYYLWHRFRSGTRYDLKQTVESNLLFGDVSYVHFCHKAFLGHWNQARVGGLRSVLRHFDHWLRARLEPWAYRRKEQLIVVPSRGLCRELETTYPWIASKLLVLPNPVALTKMARPKEFDRDSLRRQLGFSSRELVFVFVALGHFERKGLPLLLDALAVSGNEALKLIVVGGDERLIASWRERASRMGLERQVVFVGSQKDIRPYLWTADVFTLPSHYEVFPLVVLEAAASALPLLVTRVHGVEEFFTEGQNGLAVVPTRDSLLDGLQRFSKMASALRMQMGANARSSVAEYAESNFIGRWRTIYQRAAER